MKLNKKNIIATVVCFAIGFSLLANIPKAEAATMQVEAVSQIPVSEQITETEAEEPIIIESDVEEIEAEAPTGEWVSAGIYKVTHYCRCKKCCGKWSGGPTASGVMPQVGRTIATSKNIAFGTKMLIKDNEYVVEDRGVGKNCIDIFVESHSQALKMGTYKTEVYIWKAAK